MHRALSILAASALLLASKPDPGHVTARRLNRYEYNATVRNLLAVDARPANDFPADDSGYGFDNIGDVLSLPPVLLEKYLHSAEKIARLALENNAVPKATLQTHSRSDNRVAGPGLTVNHVFPAEGDYTILIGASTGLVGDSTKVSLSLDSQPATSPPLDHALENRRAAELTIHVASGVHILAAEITSDPPSKSYISSLQVRGPYNAIAPPPSESYRRVFSCGHPPGRHTLECSRANLARLAGRAYRRPASDNEIDGLLQFVKTSVQEGDSVQRGMEIALQAILVSPNFLFRIERDPHPENPSVHNLDQFELATRLSYFLWSSMPDDELFQLAAQRRLRSPSTLHAQIHRMLLDPKSQALVENFGGQWLEIRNLASIHPDPEKFSAFNDNLRQAMLAETQFFFRSIMLEDRSILDFIGANYTYLNEPLANFYGIPGIEGKNFRRVDLPTDSHRGGILTQASVLTVSSYASRTSPVLRGKWVLDNILNAPPPPPPSNVPNLDETAIGMSASARQQMEQHRSNPACRSCHARMDPLGFGLENYDAIGRWRTQDGNFPIDAGGTLPDGRTFDGPDQLKTLLLEDKNAFAECLTEKLLIYGLGRGLTAADRTTVENIVRRTAAANYKFSRLIEEIVSSEPFQKRRGEKPAGQG